jgi:hypothetical protein
MGMEEAGKVEKNFMRAASSAFLRTWRERMSKNHSAAHVRLTPTMPLLRAAPLKIRPGVLLLLSAVVLVR